MNFFGCAALSADTTFFALAFSLLSARFRLTVPFTMLFTNIDARPAFSIFWALLFRLLTFRLASVVFLDANSRPSASAAPWRAVPRGAAAGRAPQTQQEHALQDENHPQNTRDGFIFESN